MNLLFHKRKKEEEKTIKLDDGPIYMPLWLHGTGKLEAIRPYLPSYRDILSLPTIIRGILYVQEKQLSIMCIILSLFYSTPLRHSRLGIDAL